VNHSSQPGINTTVLLGKKRSITTSMTKVIAHQYARDIIMVPRKSYVLDTSLYYIGGREKRMKSPYSDPFKILKSRMVLAQEDVPTIIGQSLVVNINESLQRRSEGFNWGGRLNGRGSFMDFVGNLKPKHPGMINFSTDFSGHDNNVTENEIIVGMGLLRCCYPEGDEIDRLFYYITSSLVFKRVVAPDSHIIYELSKGLPTGHSFTSILTTICAYMKISVAIQKTHKKKHIKDTHLQGAGDDWNGLTHKRYLKQVSDHINKFSGAKCDPFEENSGLITDDLEVGKPTFLKKNYKHGLIAWNQPEFFVNLSYPTS
jgi:hypothetical protein